MSAVLDFSLFGLPPSTSVDFIALSARFVPSIEIIDATFRLGDESFQIPLIEATRADSLLGELAPIFPILALDALADTSL